MTLHELAKLPGNEADKQWPDHSFAGQNYLHYYERHFEALRDKPITLLEIGFKDGFGARLWRDYFAKGQIHGLDINPNTVTEHGERIRVHIGDQNSDEDLRRVVSATGKLDIVIDDGSHLVGHMLTSFQALWPHMVSGGLYCMEDLSCTYHAADSGWPGMGWNRKDTDFANDRSKLDALFTRIFHALDRGQGDVRSVHFYSMVAVIEKV